MTTVLDILQATRKLLADPAHWTQGASARDKEGTAIGSNFSKSKSAVEVNDDIGHEAVLAVLDHAIKGQTDHG